MAQLLRGFRALYELSGSMTIGMIVASGITTVLVVLTSEWILWVLVAVMIALELRLIWLAGDLDDEPTEFGAQFYALQASDREIAKIRTKAASKERLDQAREVFNRHQRVINAARHGAARDSSEL